MTCPEGGLGHSGEGRRQAVRSLDGERGEGHGAWRAPREDLLGALSAGLGGRVPGVSSLGPVLGG